MKIYIVDDDQSIRDSLKAVLEDEDFEATAFETGSEMLQNLEKERPDLILLDVWLGSEDGLDILDKIMVIYPMLPVLMISGHGTIEQAVIATKKGAMDFLEKPLSLDHVLNRINEILKLDDRNKQIEMSSSLLEFDEIIGVSKPIVEMKKSIARASGTNARVFIYGEHGIGKELVARTIYKNSKRSSKVYIDLNCSLVPEVFIERELFGSEKTDSSGKTEIYKGKFEQADGGTLFLDDICNLNPATQVRLLNSLEELKFVRMGGKDEVQVDVRIISATNIDPLDSIRQGKFREDLYYRLNVIPINIAPLRSRLSDIPLLLEHFLKETSEKNQLPLKRFTPSALEFLVNYKWPGNVLELKNFVERICILSQENDLNIELVKENIHDVKNHTGESDVQISGDFKSAKEDFERNYIIEALRKNEKNISRAARFLGMERTNLHRKIKSLGIDPENI
ncbi:MAG: sigma-54 dependent transcriptional regulator [Spirochaetia bacterium]|nr:sigma-54 dependent transcriptional regulator [Spirochaetia bacterium]